MAQRIGGAEILLCQRLVMMATGWVSFLSRASKLRPRSNGIPKVWIAVVLTSWVATSDVEF
jgi:hypothetical protein